MLCASLRLPLEVEGVENLLISERGSSNISRNPALEMRMQPIISRLVLLLPGKESMEKQNKGMMLFLK